MLVILCGIPCTGKTQLALELAKELDFNHGLHTMIADPDRIREMMPALRSRFDPKQEAFIESLTWTLIDQSLEKLDVVISDDLNYYESARHRLIGIARKHRAEYIIILLLVSVEVAQRRNATRGTPIPQELISKIAKRFDTPGGKYKWDKPDLVLDSEKLTATDAAKRALDIILNRIKAKTEEAQGRPAKSGSRLTKVRTQQGFTGETLDESTRR